MNTPNETAQFTSLPPDSFADMAQAPGGAPVAGGINPDDPPWGVPMAAFGWIASVILLFMIQFFFLIPYAIIHYRGTDLHTMGEALQSDKFAILLSIIAVIPAHLLTFAVIWAIVTRFGRRPFWETLGWGWAKNFGFWKSAGLAVVLLVAGGLVAKLFNGKPTDIDMIVASSAAARYTLAFLATLTAPLVEEMIYRGLLFSALQRWFTKLFFIQGISNPGFPGMTAAVIIVSGLFAFVHVFQYQNNFGVIAAVALLSVTLTLVRALTHRLLPCVAIHMIFNGLQSVIIILDPYINKPDAEQKTAAIVTFAHIFLK
ncbi:MAG TPA: CPBP family intramembrane glutamic endopeptidase [Pyrinomonadaceae bacterium]|nr:CPBP family intramembrane glutamic endopeptidase [Pyrinomonadaceae bacterium]